MPARDDDVRFTVADEGPGLTADDRARAFDGVTLHERYRHVRRAGTGVGEVGPEPGSQSDGD